LEIDMFPLVLFGFLVFSAVSEVRGSLPVVTWHGINNNAAGNEDVVRALQDVIPDLYVYNVMIGGSNDMDKLNSILMTAINQIDYVCRQIQADPRLADGYNGVGVSQGGLMIRGLAQRCPNPPMKTLVTYGAPSAGIFGVPDCESTTGSYELCEFVRQILAAAAYDPDMQDLVAPAQYWRDPLNHTNFLEGSYFLADLNNLREEKNEQYKQIISGLDNFIMIKWEDDETIIPKESSHFGFYVEGQDTVTESMEESEMFKGDWLGLMTLERTGRLHQFSLPGGHMNMEFPWFKENVVKPFLV